MGVACGCGNSPLTLNMHVFFHMHMHKVLKSCNHQLGLIQLINNMYCEYNLDL